MFYTPSSPPIQFLVALSIQTCNIWVVVTWNYGMINGTHDYWYHTLYRKHDILTQLSESVLL